MSYDLFFEAGPGKTLDRKTFLAYFKDRPHYAASKKQAVYENEDTAVAFIFDAPEEGVVAFNLNFFRPHMFGLEAALELEAFAEAFDATVIDPQAGETGEPGPFNREKFLRSWNDGNRFAYRAMLKDQEQVYTWPARRIREVWAWNYSRPGESDWKDGDLFVPGIFGVLLDDQVKSIAVWPPETRILLPAVDTLLVPLAQSGKQSKTTALVMWDEVLPVVQPYEEKSTRLPRYRLEFDQWPPEVDAFLTKKRTAPKQVKGLTLDQVLDQELVEEARRPDRQVS